MMAAIEKNKEAEQKKAQTAKKSVSEEETKKTEKPTSGDKSNVTTKVTTGCYFGNCNEGFGGYLYAPGGRYIGGWQRSNRDGYGISKDRLGKRTCESFWKSKKLEGLQVCLTSGLVATANFYVDGKKSGDSISWDARSGKITSISAWSNGTYLREARIDSCIPESQ